MEYTEEITKEMIKRTKANLECARKEVNYEVTLLINSLLGLLILPKEAYFDKILNKSVSPEMLQKIQNSCSQEYLKSSEFKLSDYVRHMRNAFCHGHFKMRPEKITSADKIPEVKEITIWDGHSFRSTLSIDLLESFVDELSNSMI